MNTLEATTMLRELVYPVESVLQSGEILSDDFQGLIAQTLELLLSRIESPIKTPPSTPQMTQAMPSSNIDGFSYDDKNNRLYVRFLGDYPNRNGSVYSYENVPKVIFDLFKKGAIPAQTQGKNEWGQWWKGKLPSIGASLDSLLKKGGFAYNRVS